MPTAYDIAIQIDRTSNEPFYLQASNAVADAVADRRLKPGDRLPTESELARRLGINRLTVSRAYDHLKARDVIVQSPGRGSFVAAAPFAARGGARSVRDVAFVLGESSVDAVPSFHQFIIFDILRGITDGLDEGARVAVVEGIPPASREDADAFDAFVLLYPHCFAADRIARLQRLGAPIVRLDAPLALLGVPTVWYDSRRCAGLAVERLLDCGYRRLGYIGHVNSAAADSYALDRKFAAFVATLRNRGLDFRFDDVYHCSLQPGDAYAAATELLRRGDPPEALFVSRDYWALEVLAAFKAAGAPAPDDIGVVGYDGIQEGAASDPPLTTVRPPRYEIGSTVAEMLREWPEDGATPADVILQPELVERGSTRALGAPTAPQAGCDSRQERSQS